MGRKRLPDLRIPTDSALVGYLAGLLDGEGHISITSAFDRKSVNRSHTLRVLIVNTDERLMCWLVDTLGGGLMTRKARRKANWKDAFVWGLYAHQAEAFLTALLPYLIIKKEQARIALAFRKCGFPKTTFVLDPKIVEQREDFKQKLQLLNRRGVA